MEVEPKNAFEKFIFWCKKHHLGWLAFAVLIVAVFFAGKKFAGTGKHVGSGNSSGNAGDLAKAGEQVAAAAAGVAAGAGDLEHIATGLEDAGKQLQPVVEGLESDQRDSDRLELLLLELRRRIESRDSELKEGKQLVEDRDRSDGSGSADSTDSGPSEVGGR